jgi:DNA-binding MarR family transcriptional regulator
VLGRYAPLSAGEIAARTAMDKVQVSRALARLGARRLVARRADGEDRRRAALELTAAGRAVHDGIVPLARAKEAELLAVLGAEERMQLDRLLDVLSRQAARLAGIDDLFSAPRAALRRPRALPKASSRRRSQR